MGNGSVWLALTGDEDAQFNFTITGAAWGNDTDFPVRLSVLTSNGQRETLSDVTISARASGNRGFVGSPARRTNPLISAVWPG